MPVTEDNRMINGNNCQPKRAPLLSYLFLSGKCGYCAAPISFRYPFVEILTCIASLYVTWHFGFSLQTLTALVFTWIAIALIVIDIDFHILPDQLTLLLLWIGLLSSVFNIFCSSIYFT